MSLVDKTLRWFIRAWVALTIAINLIAVIGFFVSAPSFWAGWQRVSDTYSPFNLWNYAAELILISPAFGAYLLLERRKKRAAKSEQQPMSTQQAQQIINAYGATTEQPADFPRRLYPELIPKHPAGRQAIDDLNAVLSKSSLRDLRTLPYPKPLIKQALLIGIALATGLDREHLRTSYVLLGDWQDPGVPDPMAAMAAEGKALLAELRAFEESLTELPVRPR